MAKPTLFGLNEAVKSAQLLFNTADKSDLEAYEKSKETLRKAKENLRIFIYKQKGHVSANGRSLRI
jgi:hypothetical protein